MKTICAYTAVQRSFNIECRHVNKLGLSPFLEGSALIRLGTLRDVGLGDAQTMLSWKNCEKHIYLRLEHVHRCTFILSLQSVSL